MFHFLFLLFIFSSSLAFCSLSISLLLIYSDWLSARDVSMFDFSYFRRRSHFSIQYLCQSFFCHSSDAREEIQFCQTTKSYRTFSYVSKSLITFQTFSNIWTSSRRKGKLASNPISHLPYGAYTKFANTKWSVFSLHFSRLINNNWQRSSKTTKKKKIATFLWHIEKLCQFPYTHTHARKYQHIWWNGLNYQNNEKRWENKQTTTQFEKATQ